MATTRARVRESGAQGSRVWGLEVQLWSLGCRAHGLHGAWMFRAKGSEFGDLELRKTGV